MSAPATTAPGLAVSGLDPYDQAVVHLGPAARAALDTLRATLERDVAPLLADAWERATMPDAVLDALVALDLMQPEGVDEREAASSLFSGLRAYVLARCDVSVATLYTAQSGLFRAAVRHGGSAEQVARLDPAVRSFALRGAFALTEPEHGSDVAGGLATSARREGGTWVLDGAKRWIGGAARADVLAVFARDVADGQVKAFLVPRDAPGVGLGTITGKTALRLVPNATVMLDGVRVSDDQRLGRVDGWGDVARILRSMRADVAWVAAGLQAGALDAALRYTTSRHQFGRPVAGFQLVQEKLARMLGNATSSLATALQLALAQDRGEWSDAASALAKMHTARTARETVALAREVAGGNGILLEHDVARFFADAEAVYSYEGTHEVTSLVVGRALTGLSAFV